MPFAQRHVEPRLVSRVRLFDDEGHPKVTDGELEAVTNGTLCNALRQLASLVAAADSIFDELADELKRVHARSQQVKQRIDQLQPKVDRVDPKAVTVRYEHTNKYHKYGCGTAGQAFLGDAFA
ncbi:unnamed protein product [Acanthoscelides obtectus]|uniref:Uncharacterized protein n=1 Tax=Acanthoscelides obtectus TaxID=200917 RepID=A0A9P0KAD5_ACAOB|nr:unnamed protein product [Acanthoscelides obtectus]CAK1629303.1 Wiskott-Aldrich syndrome protein family member 2 [Acanthoscelides obtectus]